MSVASDFVREISEKRTLLIVTQNSLFANVMSKMGNEVGFGDVIVAEPTLHAIQDMGGFPTNVVLDFDNHKVREFSSIVLKRIS